MKFYDHTSNRPPHKPQVAAQSHSGSIAYNEIPPNTPQTLHDFNERIKKAITQKSKSFTMTIDEANSLFIAINGFIVEQKEMNDVMFALKSQIIEERQKGMEKIIIDFDGGGLKRG